MNVRTVVIGFDLFGPLDRLLRETGQDWVSPAVAAFKEEQPIRLTSRAADLVHFGRPIGSDEAIRLMSEMGRRPGTLRELIVFGRLRPELQCAAPIVALGSRWKTESGTEWFHPALDGRTVRRQLDLMKADPLQPWGAPWRFLAVPLDLESAW